LPAATDAQPELQVTDTALTSEAATLPQPYATQHVWFAGCAATGHRVGRAAGQWFPEQERRRRRAHRQLGLAARRQHEAIVRQA
jgi:hypothetical protein